MFGGLFKRWAKREAAELPASVEALIDGMSVIEREDDDEGNPRILLTAASGPNAVAWHHTPEETRKRLVAAFPELNEAQLDRACLAVAALVRTTLGSQGAAPAKRHRSEWASWAPARRLSELPGLPDPRNF